MINKFELTSTVHDICGFDVKMVHLIFVEIVESFAAVVKQHADLLLCQFYVLLVQFVEREG